MCVTFNWTVGLSKSPVKIMVHVRCHFLVFYHLKPESFPKHRSLWIHVVAPSKFPGISVCKEGSSQRFPLTVYYWTESLEVMPEEEDREDDYGRCCTS